MDQRINDHISNRPKSWDTLEKPLNISESFSDNQKYDTIILDCINLLSSNALLLPENSNQAESDFVVMNQVEDGIENL